MKLKSIDEIFAEYLSYTFRSTLSDEQHATVRRVFFSGFLACLAEIGQMQSLPEDEKNERYQGICDEMKTWACDLATKANKAKGSA